MRLSKAQCVYVSHVTPGPMTVVRAVVGHTAKLPCDLSATRTWGEPQLVLFFYEQKGTPIYRYVGCTSKNMQYRYVGCTSKNMQYRYTQYTNMLPMQERRYRYVASTGKQYIATLAERIINKQVY